MTVSVMKDEIIYDFKLSKTVCNSLEEVVQSLHKDIIGAECDNLDLLAGAWRSDGAEIFALQYGCFISDVCKLRDELIDEIEHIERTSQKMLLIEQEAQKRALEKGNGV